MYASFLNHAPNLIKFTAAFIILFIVLPRFIFPKSDDDKLEDLVSGYIRMVFLVIILGYLLVVLKLYELISILCVFGLLITLNKTYLNKRFGSTTRGLAPAILLDSLEGQVNLKEKAKTKITKYLKDVLHEFTIYLKPLKNRIFLVLFIISAFYLAYLRFYDAFVHASVPLSDSYTTLAWFKNVENDVLFYNNGGGVYPRGLSMYLAVIHKFTNINELYVLKYTGPLNSILICLSIYFFVFRMTMKRYAGLLAMIAFGVGGYLFGLSWERQPATNSQELAMVFLLPIAYYTYKYLKLKRKQDLITLLAAASVAGLIHSMIYAIALLLSGLIITYSLFVKFKGVIIQVLQMTVIFFISGLISVAPILIGKLSGVGLNDSAVSFLTSSSNFGLRELLTGDKLAAASLLIIIAYSVHYQITHKRLLNPYSAIALSGLVVFLLYYAGGALTKNEVVATRLPEAWSVLSAALVGVAAAVLFNSLKSETSNDIFGVILSALLILMFLFYIKPPMMAPYKMEWDSSTEEYLKIAGSYAPKTWMLVGEAEQYALVFGSGFHEYISDFIHDFTPDPKARGQWRNIAENIFIYQQKNIFRVGSSSGILSIEEPIYERREKEKIELQKWLDEYRANGGKYDIFYDDKNLRILYIKNMPEKEKNTIWE